MDFSATQVYENENSHLFTQEVSHTLKEEKPFQVGTLSINSIDYQIKTGTTKIGRLTSCNIVIKDQTVSKLHAEIEAGGSRDSTWICDLKSSNKTKLNNLILRPNRAYELKDGSVIEFGRVHAIYRAYCPANDTVIPETPAPPRQKTTNTIIPNTPDSFLNNSSSVDNDGSIILGTQKNDENSVFRQPRVPHQCSSPSISKNTSKNESKNDSQSATTLRTSDINVSESQVNINDIKMEKFDEGYKRISNSIYDMETQEPIDVSKHVERNAKADKQLSKLNVCDKTASSSATDIHDMEIQNCIDNINKMETQKSNDIRNVTENKFMMDIHTMETQIYTEDGSNAQKSEINKSNSREKSSTKFGCDIHDLETQKFDNKYIAEDISDLETQLELDNIARSKQNRDISDMETQIKVDDIVKTSDNQANKKEDRNSVADIENRINHEDITKSPKSRSSSPRFLNLSSPGVEGPSSPLNQSGHLLESSDLLEFFCKDIDKQGVQAFNASTPKSLIKVSSKKNNDVDNVQNMVNNDEDIFEAPTQRISHKFEDSTSDDFEIDEEDAVVTSKVSKKKCGKLQSKQTNDDSETDAEEYIAELVEKQCKSKTLSKLSNEDVNDPNRNDPTTSTESEDLFDAQTQRLDNLITKDTNSLINQSQNSNKINEAKNNDMASTQIINNDQDLQTSTPISDIDNAAPTQLILSCETSLINSIDLASKNNLNNEANKQIDKKSVDNCITENLDHEDIDYELAPTQVIGEIENKRKVNSTCEENSSQSNLNDTLEQKLTEMFDEANNDINSTHELPHMSTQYLKNILESQCDDSTNKFVASDKNTGSVPQKQTEKKNHAPCNQLSHNLLNTETNTNVNKIDTDSQDSDVYFSTIITRRKRNILTDTQELANSAKDITPSGQDVSFSLTSKTNNEKTMDDNVTMEFNKKRKRITKTKNKSGAIMNILNDNDSNKIISSESNEKTFRSSKLMKPEEKDEPGRNEKTKKQVLRSDLAKFEVDNAEEKTSICTPCPSEDGQRAQTFDTLHESDDDILMRLPAVRISGTLSNPASPSASSTSTVHSTRSKRGNAKNKKNKGKEDTKLLHKRDIENSDKNSKLSIDNRSNLVLDNLMNDKITGLVDTSDDSDNESKYKQFQMADRMLNDKLNCPKGQNKRSRKSARVSSDVSEDLKQNTDVESKDSAWINSRITRRSRKQNDESLHHLQKDTFVKNIAATESKTKSVIAKRKIPLNMIEENVKQITSKKPKTVQVTEECSVSTCDRRSTKTATNRQSPNILEYSKMGLHESISENMKSSEDSKVISKTTLEETEEISLNMKADRNVYPGKVNVKRTRHRIYDSQVAIHVTDVTVNENRKKSKPTQKRIETQANQLQDKVLKVLLSPIKCFADDGSQEVESIMARGNNTNNLEDKNLLIRKSNKAKIFQRELRSKKRQNSDTETDSILTESSSISSEIVDSDNAQLDDFVPKTKRGKSIKSPVSSLPEAQVSIKKKKTFKKPRINQNSTSSVLDSLENMTSESSQSNTESEASTSSGFSKSKTRIRKKEKIESNQNTRKLTDKNAARLNISTEMIPLVSTPSRTRRNTFSLNNSMSAMRHKVLFTGITEDYSKIVKTLGGSKVEDPAKCTILVTDKVRRTYKFLCALAKGIPIVAIDWLKESETAERFLDWENYILKDPAAEAKFGFRLRKSLDKAKEKKLLDDYIVVLTPCVAPPPVEELKDIVSSCGGRALLRPPAKWPERAVILSREEDLPNAKKFLVKAPKTVTVQSTEFILTGILRQETDFIKYKLT